MLKGAGLDVLWPHAAAMLLMGLLVTAVAVRNLSRSLDSFQDSCVRRIRDRILVFTVLDNKSPVI